MNHMVLHRRVWCLAALTTCLFLLSGCPQARGLPDRHIKRKVNPSELVGTWHATEASLKRLIQEGYSLYTDKGDQRIVLCKDGTCHISTYSYTVFKPTPKEEKRYYIRAGEGTWNITKARTYVRHREVKVPVVEITLVEQKQSLGKSIASYTTIRLFIVEEGERIVLWHYIGDPDYVEYMDFVRISR